MPSNRQGQIILIFIIASLLLHAVVFALASQFRIEPRKFEEPEKPRTITLRRIEPPPEPEPAQPPPQDMFVPTLDNQETAEADPNTNLISERNTQARTQETPRDPNSMMPEMSGAERNALNYQTIQGLPGQQPGVPGQQNTPPTKQQPPTEQTAEAKEQQQQEVEKPQEAEEMPKEKPVESEVVEKFEKVEDPQDAKAEEVIELAKKNPNDLPLRPERVYPTDAMPLLKPEPRREKARPLQKVENPEKMAEKAQPVTPPTPAGGFSASRVRSDVQGGGRRGDYSASSRASAEGRYMAKLHRAIGSYWYLSLIHL